MILVNSTHKCMSTAPIHGVVKYAALQNSEGLWEASMQAIPSSLFWFY